MDEEAGPLDRDHSLCVVLPGGLEKHATVPGSRPVMDLLVTLCASYHLNPSDYTVEALSANKNNISFKPNSPIGLLEAEKIVLKPKGAEERPRRPYMPEATVRLLVNYNKAHKTVVRVNPKLPLELLLPAVCGKCEFDVETTVLLRDARSEDPLDLGKTLNEHGLREVFARDTAAERGSPERRAATPEPAAVAEETPVAPPPETPKKKQKENSGFFSLFRRRKKKNEANGLASAPASPRFGKTAEGVVLSSSTLPADTPKKRRAPQPPMGASVSVPDYLGSCHLTGAQRSESTLRSTKRRAPPPPCLAPLHPNVQGSLQLRESDERDSANLSPSSAHPPPSSSSSRSSLAHLHDAAEPYLPAFRGKDLSDARAALARVLTSSVSKGTLLKRLKKSANFSKLPHGSPSSYNISDHDVFRAELESVLRSDLPTENEWEEPTQRRGMTTFKVVPQKRPSVPEPEATLELPDESWNSPNGEGGASPEDAGKTQRSENEATSSGPQRSPEGIQSPPPLQEDCDEDISSVSPPFEVVDTAGSQEEVQEPEGTPAEPSGSCEEVTREFDAILRDEEESVQSPSADSEICADEEVVQEVVEQEKEEEEEEASFPPPPPPVFFTEELDTMEDTVLPASTSQPTSPPPNGRCEAPESTSAGPRRSLSGSAPSRFAQAVAMAVQRSRRRSHSKSSGPQESHGSVPSPPRSSYQYGA